MGTKLKFYKDITLIYNSGARGNHLGAVLGAERTGLRGGEEKELEFSWGERLIESTYQSSAAGALEKLREHPWFNAMAQTHTHSHSAATVGGIRGILSVSSCITGNGLQAGDSSRIVVKVTVD